MASISTKIYLLRTQPTLIRRFQINSDYSFADFDRLVREAFGIANSEFKYSWKYQDDEQDWVSFSSEGEWKDALFFHSQSNGKILRLQLTKEQPESFARPHGRGHGWRQFHGHQPRHWGVRCDGCNQSGIVGDRYKCTECPDFDFCGTCYNSSKFQEHGNHKFEKIERPIRGRHHRLNRMGFKSFQDGEDTVFHCPLNAEFLNKFGNVEQAKEALSKVFSRFGVDVEIATEEPKPQEEKPVEQPEAVEQPKEEPVQQPEPVVESKPVEEVQPVQQPEPVVAPVVEQAVLPQPAYEEVKPVEPFAEQLETLRVMGFENVALNKHLLSNYKGDLTRVVNSLLQLSQFRQ